MQDTMAVHGVGTAEVILLATVMPEKKDLGQLQYMYCF